MDDESMWQSLDAEDEETVSQYTDTLGSRLSCFAYTHVAARYKRWHG